MAETYVLSGNGDLGRVPMSDFPAALQSWFDKAEKTAREALRLDSRNVDGHLALADMQRYRGNWVEAEELFRQTLALDPNDPDVLNRYAVFVSSIGRIKEDVRIHEKLRMLEPFVPAYSVGLASSMQDAGEYRASIPILEALPAGGGRNINLARAYAYLGQYAKAADTLLAIPQTPDLVYRRVEDAARLLRSAPAKAASPDGLPEFQFVLVFVYAHIGALDRVLAYYERLVSYRYIAGLGDIWAGEYTPLRKTERFKALVRKVGLVDYWRAKGWPDLCRPMGANDFVCD